MALRDPVAVYNAANNIEANLVQRALLATGIEAHLIEDISQVGTWMGGVIPEIHKPQVWVEREDVERATAVMNVFEQRAAERRAPGDEGNEGGAPVEAVCEECGGVATFPSAQRGSVQQCPHCDAYLDVGGEDISDEWSASASEEDAAEEA